MYGEKLIRDITALDIEDFITSLLQRDCRYANHPYRKRVEGPPSISYVQGFERAIRRLMNFSQHRGWISADRNPWRAYEPLRDDPSKELKSCELDDVLRLLAATEGDSVGAVRDRTIVYLLLDTGCRLSGLTNLRISNINWADRTFRTFEKGRFSTYSFSARAADQLREWLAVREKFLGGAL
jgi:integrase